MMFLITSGKSMGLAVELIELQELLNREAD